MKSVSKKTGAVHGEAGTGDTAVSRLVRLKPSPD